jgi:hypothetical protein
MGWNMVSGIITNSNPKSNKTDFQQSYETRRKKQNIEELKIIQEAGNELNAMHLNRMKLRSTKNNNRSIYFKNNLSIFNI